MKRLLQRTAVALILCLVSGLQPAQAALFPDVPGDFIFRHAIEYVADEGIVSGYSDGTYGPSLAINRAEFTKIIVGSLYPTGLIRVCTRHQFPDVPADSWFAPYVCIAKQQGMVGGYPDGSFRPAQTINFAEAAKIIANAYKSRIDFLPLVPSEVEPWYKQYIVSLGQQNAIPITIAAPVKELTRGEMAEIIFRLHAGERGKVSLSYKDFDPSYEEDEDGVEVVEKEKLIPSTTSTTSTTHQFIHRQGNKLYDGTQKVHLRGINVQALWMITPDGEWTIDDHEDQHTMAVYEYPENFGTHTFERVADMNMNVIRLELNYRMFEDNANPYAYKQSGWDWLDNAVELAKQYNIYLILDLHSPPGGLQPTGGGGAGLWDDRENQQRLKTLWKAIAERYAEETIIAGYDLLNEPNPSQTAKQWHGLAQELVDTIREVDRNHLIIVEQVNWVVDANGRSPDSSEIYKDWQFLVDDPLGNQNVMYDFHFYDPFDYTHQLTDWTGKGDGGAYPDANILERVHYDTDYLDQDTQLPRTKEYLEYMIDNVYAPYYEQHNVPINVGEWGAFKRTFLDDKGGLEYTEDLLDLLLARGYHFQYFTLGSVYFQDWELEQYPGLAEASNELVQLFKGKLR